MAEHGYNAATVAALVDEAGIPASSIYHYFGSKEGILLAVMERGAARFFESLPIPERRLGSEAAHLLAVVETSPRHSSGALTSCGSWSSRRHSR
jgi:AcrR family transcriptional regulator